MYILVLQRFRVVYHGIITISHMSLVFSRYTLEPLGEYLYLENTLAQSDSVAIFCLHGVNKDHLISQNAFLFSMSKRTEANARKKLLYLPEIK